MKPTYFRKSGTRKRTAELDKKIIDIFMGDLPNDRSGNLKVFAYNSLKNHIMVLDNVLYSRVSANTFEQEIGYNVVDPSLHLMNYDVLFTCNGYTDVMVDKYVEAKKFLEGIDLTKGAHRG